MKPKVDCKFIAMHVSICNILERILLSVVIYLYLYIEFMVGGLDSETRIEL